ncbi:MAG: hypothetical protein WAJ85_14560 [Candidatus Baltobacteraceae bacterium]
MARSDVRIGSHPTALSAAVLFFAASLTALLSHLAIDVLGNWFLADDAYDHVAHDSRALICTAVLGCALAALAFAARAALREARGSEGALRDVLRAALPASPWRYLAPVAAASLMLVTAMEALDASLAGRPPDDVADLLGGSLELGLGVVAAVAAVVTAAVWCCVRRLARLHRTLVELAVAFVSLLRAAGRGVVHGAAWRPFRTCAHALLLARRAAGRAPPRSLRAAA